MEHDQKEKTRVTVHTFSFFLIPFLDLNTLLLMYCVRFVRDRTLFVKCHEQVTFDSLGHDTV